MAAKLISLDEWAKAKYGTPPHANTLRRWARDGFIQPAAVKQGRAYLVREDAVYSDYRNPISSLVDRISR